MLIGADPELFLVSTQGKLISSIGIIGGSKEEPRIIREDGCAVQEDNVAVEFNIPPADTVTKFLESINFNLTYLENFVREKGLSLAIHASGEFEADQLKSRKAREFGCDPDLNAWTRQPNPSPRSDNRMLRSAGGHVHVGFEGERLNPLDVIKAMDVFLAVPSVLHDDDTRRRELYGKAGACRIKSYGVEYRTLSNFWLKTDQLKEWVFHQTHLAVAFVRNSGYISHDEGEAIQHCINTSDKNLAVELCAHYGVA